MMTCKFRLSAIAISVIGLAISISPCSGAPALALLFDNVGNDDEPMDSGGSGAIISWLPDRDLAISDEKPKFGKGSLKAMADSPSAMALRFQDGDNYDIFATETRELTIAVWLYLPDTEGEPKNLRIVSREGGENAHGTWFFTLIQGTRPYFSAISVNPDGATIASQVNVSGDHWVEKGVWTHFAMTFNAGEVVLYVNGYETNRGLAETESLPEQGLENVHLLRYNILGMPAGAFADDLAVFPKKALTGDEIQLLADKGLAAFLTKSKN